MKELLLKATVAFFVGLILGHYFGGWIPLIGVVAVVVCGAMLFSKKQVIPQAGFLYGIYVLAFLFGGLLGSRILGTFFIWLGQLIS